MRLFVFSQTSQTLGINPYTYAGLPQTSQTLGLQNVGTKGFRDFCPIIDTPQTPHRHLTVLGVFQGVTRVYQNAVTVGTQGIGAIIDTCIDTKIHIIDTCIDTSFLKPQIIQVNRQLHILVMLVSSTAAWFKRYNPVSHSVVFERFCTYI